MDLRDEREALRVAIAAEADEALSLAHWMARHPELSLAEFATSERYQQCLASRGFTVEAGVAGMPTAFRAGWGQGEFSGALLAEMDALPEIGHACGHNLSGPASLLAAAALVRVLPEDIGRLYVLGCPAEETGVGKRRLVEAGQFDGIDVAMMAHASDMRRAHRLFLGNRKFDLVFHGRASHAAAYPERGRNALDAVVQLMGAIGLMRQQLPRTVRAHGIITDGGQAANIIPERAAAEIWVRALDPDDLDTAAERVLACARGAAETAGVELEANTLESSSPPLFANRPLAACYGRQLERLGLPESGHAPDENIGSSDITHVSHALPTIHPNFPIGEGLQLHTREFAEATTTPEGEAGMIEAATALAWTLHELFRCPAARAAVRAEGRAEGIPA